MAKKGLFQLQLQTDGSAAELPDETPVNRKDTKEIPVFPTSMLFHVNSF